MQIHLIYYLGFLWDVVVHVFCAGTACCVYIYMYHISVFVYIYIYTHEYADILCTGCGWD